MTLCTFLAWEGLI